VIVETYHVVLISLKEILNLEILLDMITMKMIVGYHLVKILEKNLRRKRLTSLNKKERVFIYWQMMMKTFIEIQIITNYVDLNIDGENLFSDDENGDNSDYEEFDLE